MTTVPQLSILQDERSHTSIVETQNLALLEVLTRVIPLDRHCRYIAAVVPVGRAIVPVTRRRQRLRYFLV